MEMNSDFKEFFKKFNKKNGINLDDLYYFESKYEFKFCIKPPKSNNMYSLEGDKVYPLEDVNKIFIKLSNANDLYFKYIPIKSSFLYGKFEKKVDNFFLKNVEYQGLGICKVVDETLSYNKLTKIEEGINSIKNLEKN